MSISNSISSIKKDLVQLKIDVSKYNSSDCLLDKISPEHQQKLIEFTSCESDTLSDAQAKELREIMAFYKFPVDDDVAKYWPAECRWIYSLSPKEREGINTPEIYEEEFNKHLREKGVN